MTRLDPLQKLGIPRRECVADELQAHLQGFIDSFVLPEYADRVRLMIRRGVWMKVAAEIEKHLDPDTCREWKDQSRPDPWPATFAVPGIYLADLEVGLGMSVGDAAALSWHTTCDALFSIEPGRRAVFLNHDWGVWYCEKP